eukprot:6202407-Pleurochrysis_carterae.AAC.1
MAWHFLKIPKKSCSTSLTILSLEPTVRRTLLDFSNQVYNMLFTAPALDRGHSVNGLPCDKVPVPDDVARDRRKVCSMFCFLNRQVSHSGQDKKQSFNSLFPTLINPACWKIIHELLQTSKLPAVPPTVPTVAPPRRPLLPPASMV